MDSSSPKVGTHSPVDLAAARERYQSAELRLRQLLFGDVYYDGGRLKGEEPRARATAELRRMRVAFDELLAVGPPAAGIDLAEDLRDEARSAAKNQRPTRKRLVSGREDRPKITAETMADEMLAAAREVTGAPWTKIR